MSSFKSQTRALPERPNLEQLKKQARALLRAWQQGEPNAQARLAAHHPRATGAASNELKLADALLVLAREHGYPSFPKLKSAIEQRSTPEPVVVDGALLPALRCERPLLPFGTMHLDAGLVPAESGLVLVVWRGASLRVASIAELTPVRGRNGVPMMRLDWVARARFEWRDDARRAQVTPIVDAPPSEAERKRMGERLLRAAEPLARQNEWVSLTDLEGFARTGSIGPLLAQAAAYCELEAQQRLVEARDLRQMVALLVDALGRASGAPNPRPPARSVDASASLVVLHAAHHPHLVGRRYPLHDALSVIGRGADCAVQLLSSAISRQHAQIVRSGVEHALEDLRSTNGCFLNHDAEPVQRAPLSDGDRLKLGDALLCFVTGDDSEARCLALAREAADYDALTQTLRERSFWRESERAMLEARSTGEPLSVLVVEVAAQAALERREGLLAGEALRSVAADTLRQVFGSQAVIGSSDRDRDRLLVLLPHCDEQSARRLAAQLGVTERDRWGHRVIFTPRVGVAALRATGGVAELLAEAERDRPRVAA